MTPLSTIDRARGRWPEILTRLGIDSGFLRNRHGPCPLCGGRDRFRFDDRDGSGSYICSQCGAGVGVIMLRKKHGWDHRTACDAIDEIIGSDPPPPLPTAPPATSSAAREAKLRRILAEATSPATARNYLAGRGLTVDFNSTPLLGHPSLPYFDEDRRLVGRYPAMIAPIIGPDGRLQALHRTYDCDLEKRKKITPPVDTIKGAAVRLLEPTTELGIAEGIETALAGHELFDLPTWAAMTAGGLEAFQPPPGLIRLVILSDNDPNFAGQRAAYALASRTAKEIASVEVMVPPTPGTDWLDVLNERNTKGWES